MKEADKEKYIKELPAKVKSETAACTAMSKGVAGLSKSHASKTKTKNLILFHSK